MQQLACNFPQGTSPQQVLETVKGCVARHAKGEWITGGQWDAASFGKQGVHRSLLDSVSPDNPVVLSISACTAFGELESAPDCRYYLHDAEPARRGYRARCERGTYRSVARVCRRNRKKLRASQHARAERQSIELGSLSNVVPRHYVIYRCGYRRKQHEALRRAC